MTIRPYNETSRPEQPQGNTDVLAVVGGNDRQGAKEAAQRFQDL